MTTETMSKLQMTEKNLIKNMKRLDVQSEYRQEILKHAYTDSVSTYTTDSHRALKINEVVSNELVKENTEHAERIEKLMEEPYSYIEFTLSRDDIDTLRKLTKYVSSVDGKLKIKYYSLDNIQKLTIGMSEDPLYDLQVSMTIANFGNSNLNYPEHSYTTTLNAKYVTDILDFAWDNKEQGVVFKLNESNMRPSHVRGLSGDFDYIVLPMRTY